MPGLVNGFSSDALARVATYYTEANVAHLGQKQVMEGSITGGANTASAQVFATVALVEAVRELTEELKKRRG